MTESERIEKTKQCIKHYLIGTKLGVNMGLSDPADWILTNWDMRDDVQQREYSILFRQVEKELSNG
jgi:hypothetical protein